MRPCGMGVVDVTAWLNPPKSRNGKAFFVCDQMAFDKVMSAITSHVAGRRNLNPTNPC